jgi:hypothetical protein
VRKTDYFGTFLDTLNSSSAAPRRPAIKSAAASSSAASATSEPEVELERVLKLLPREADAEISIVALSKALGLGLGPTAAVMKTAEANGLVHNNRGQFSLTDLGREAAAQPG